MPDQSPAEPFEFDFGDDSPTLDAAVFQAIGAASVCWESMAGTGVFDDRRATAIGEALLAFVRSTTDPKPDPKHNPAAYLTPPTKES